MKLRKLMAKDAPFMLEWMHDDAVVHYLKEDFAGKTIEDCKNFIEDSQDEKECIHLAIANDFDEYMGTVSLKHICKNRAELGIALRSCAMGKGYGLFGLKGILALGYMDRGIDNIYWCVDPQNQRAIRFYDKNHYCKCTALSSVWHITTIQLKSVTV